MFFLNWLTAFPVSVCMRGSSVGELVPLDLEIEATFRRNNTERKRKLLHDITIASILEEAHFSESSSSNSAISRESQPIEIEAEVMAEEQHRRVTLEDYSSTSVPQFFTSIARPEVQAQNITYPHSLIQNNLFHGLPNEDPYAYLATYIDICNTVRLAGLLEDAVRLSLFSFSLSGEAKRWLN